MSKEVHVYAGKDNPFSFEWGDATFFVHFQPSPPTGPGGGLIPTGIQLDDFDPGGGGFVAMQWNPLDTGLLRNKLILQTDTTTPAVDMNVDVSGFIGTGENHALQAIMDEVQGIPAPYIVRVILQKDDDSE